MKKNLRKELLKKRNLLSKEEIHHKSLLITEKLKSRSFYKDAKHIMLYLSFDSEVLTNFIIEDLMNSNKKVYIPLTVPKTRELIVSELINLEEDLEVGNFGVLEPKKEAIRPVSVDLLDLVIVPGVGFEKSGYRIGYGGGYYDRFLPKISVKTPKVALAFEVQMIEKVPTDEYDFPVDYIITEEEIIDCKECRNPIRL